MSLIDNLRKIETSRLKKALSHHVAILNQMDDRSKESLDFLTQLFAYESQCEFVNAIREELDYRELNQIFYRPAIKAGSIRNLKKTKEKKNEKANEFKF